MEANSQARRAKNDYMREYMREYMKGWRKKNPEKAKEIRERYWQKRAERETCADEQ